MCGIVEYVGSRQAAPILLEGLEGLEYHGYDSADIAVCDGDKEPVAVRAKGRLHALADKTDNGHILEGCCDIGHTRQATHGVPPETNAHPHVSTDDPMLAVHNGISGNYLEIQEKLICHSCHFYSQTNTEAIADLTDYYYKKCKMGPVNAITRTLARVHGNYVSAIIFRDYPEQVYIVRKDNSLVMGFGEGESLIAPDPFTYLRCTRHVCYVDNFKIGYVTKDSIAFYDLNDDATEKTPVLIDWDETATEKGGYERLMVKEAHEQLKVIADTSRVYLSDKTDGKEFDYHVDLTKLDLTDESIQNLSGITVIGCDSVYHVGATAQYVIEDLAKLSVHVELVSECRYRHPVIDLSNPVVVISQSGETANMFATMREAKGQGLKTLAIASVIGPVITREVDFVLHTYAGPETSVATTRAYSIQLIGIYLLVICLGKACGLIDERERQWLLAGIAALPERIRRIIDSKKRLQWFAARFNNAKDVPFIGHGVNYAICMEGSLKVKEVSYIYSEAYAAGKLKHDTISLIEDGTLVTGVLTQSELYEKTLSNPAEVKSRGAYLMGLTTSGNYDIEDTVNFTFFFPKIDEHFVDSLMMVPLQLLGYYFAVSKGLDVDKPRNLTEFVTVE